MGTSDEVQCISCARCVGGWVGLFSEQFGHGPGGFAAAVEIGNLEGCLIAIGAEEQEGGAIAARGVEAHAYCIAFAAEGFCAGENDLANAHSSSVFADGNGVEVGDCGAIPRAEGTGKCFGGDDGEAQSFAVSFGDDAMRGAAMNHCHDRLLWGMGPTRKGFLGQITNEIVIVRPSEAYRQETCRSHGRIHRRILQQLH